MVQNIIKFVQLYHNQTLHLTSLIIVFAIEIISFDMIKSLMDEEIQKLQIMVHLFTRGEFSTSNKNDKDID